MDREQKLILIRVTVSGVLLAVSYFVPTGGIARIAILLAAYVIVGGDIICNAIRNLMHGKPFDENLLMVVATLGAFATGEYPEAVAVMLFYQIGETLQDMAVDKSKASISSLMDIRPDFANIVSATGGVHKVSPDKVPSGSVIEVLPGEKIPLDGSVISGSSSLDMAALTGESLPKEVNEGDLVLSGSVNMTGLLKVRTSGVYGESTVARILNLVENADTGKAKTEKFITKFARYYTPAVVGAAALLAIIPPLLAGGEWNEWLHRALIFLVISCPCALVVSIPLTFFAGIGGASRCGILIKGSDYLETLSKLKTVVFDKTGTLTKGNFAVSRTVPSGNCTSDSLLKTAALAEVYSDHPVAVSLRKAVSGVLDKDSVTEVENFAGEGVRALVKGRIVYVGNERLMLRAGVACTKSDDAGTIVYVAEDGHYLGYIVISDTVKPESASAVKMLHECGIDKTVMLTGDRSQVANLVAHEVGIDEVHAGLLPADKVARVEHMIASEPSGYKLAFVGDGINDAPVLKLSDVGIAMGGIGSDAAIEAADVVLMDDNPEKVATAISISSKTMKIVWQNIIFALGIKLLFLLLASLGLANMWEAVFADVGVTLLAVLNALRAMRTRI